MTIVKSIFIYLLAIVGIIFFTIGLFFLIGFTQEAIFVPDDYLLWIFKYPYSRFIFVYEFLLVFLLLYYLNKRLLNIKPKDNKSSRRKKKLVASFLLIFLLTATYTMIISVAIVKDDRIINYSPLHPMGKQYSFEEIINIDTGVYGKKLYLPFTHSKGDFFYVIELKDGTKLDLNEVGDPGDKEDYRFVLAELDKRWVNMGIPKQTSLDNFHYVQKNLDSMYSNKIKEILMNK
ncbi:7 transmembrane receptor [Bacillus kwashiorkori]|uniref:7 transmembrane receptor n=1 Tax=Bacillus kwashiorkori TaxID=1522318 RepID=UPI0007835DC2|nr:7 transmembrane receptor [Bacillus kwashiorkori]